MLLSIDEECYSPMLASSFVYTVTCTAVVDKLLSEFQQNRRCQGRGL